MTEKELKDLIKNVSEDVSELLKMDKKYDMAKVHVGEETPAEKEPDVSATSPAADVPSMDAPPADGPPADVPSMDAPPADGPPAEDKPAEGEPDAEGKPGEEVPGEGEYDVEALSHEYGQLPIDELKAHYLAAKTALAGKMSAEGSEGAPPAESAPPAPVEEPPPAMGKAEIEKAEKNAATAKAETDTLRKTVKDLQETTKRQESAMTSLMKAVAIAVTPQQKAVTIAEGSSEAVAVEDLPRNEIGKRLVVAARRSDLKKSDRNLIDQWSVGKVGVDKVKHLLVEDK